MEKYAWTGRIVEGKKAEYIKRHDEIWPEMVELLKKAGIKNYTIWNVGDTLFGYYECEYGIKFAADTQSGSEVVDRWNEYTLLYFFSIVSSVAFAFSLSVV